MKLNFTKLGNDLLPAVAQDATTGEILMLAFMNQEAFDATLRTGKATYYSRSRKQLWCKGESSGNTQEVVDIRVDCDEDAIVLKVRQIGDAACHTGFRSCFHRKWDNGDWVVEGERVFDPADVYGK